MNPRQPPSTAAWIIVGCLVLAWLFLIVTGTAKADEGIGWGPMLRADYVTAIEYWGEEPLQCSSVEKRIVALSPTDSAAATQPYPGYYGVCYLFISPRTLRDNRRQTCRTVIHEVGHLLGLEHSTEMDNVMYPTFTGWVPGICKRLWPA